VDLLKQITEQTLERVANALKGAMNDPKLTRALSVSDGLVGLQLEAPAKQLVPLMSPFRQKIGRKAQAGSNAIQWKAITAVRQNAKFSTAEGAAANPIATTVVSKTQSFKIVGTRGKVTREAIAHSQGFDDALAKETANTLLLGMKLEEQAILGGNITALATPTGLAVAVITGGGALAADATGYNVRVAALTLMAANRESMDRPAGYDGTHANLATGAKTGANPAADGWTVPAARVTSAAVSLNDRIKITWNAVTGAAAYAVFIGKNTTETLACIVTQTSITVTAAAAGGSALAVADGTSADALIFDGIVPLINAETSAYKKVLTNKLSTSGGEIVEIQDMFQSIWDSGKIDDITLLVSGVDSRTLSRLLTAAGGGPTIFVSTGEEGARGQMTQGYHVGFIINQVTGKRCLVEVLPWLPGGTIIALPNSIPYPDANISAPFEIATSYDWERIDYAATTSTGPVTEFDIRAEEVLKDHFPAGCGLLSNVFFG
jgi:hypothetical protein